MHILAVIYLIVLTAILAAGLKSPQLGWLRSALAVFLLVWAVLILTAQFLSLFYALNVTWLFVGTSILIAAGASAGLRKMGRPLRELSFPSLNRPFSRRIAAWVMAFLVVSAALVLVGRSEAGEGRDFCQPIPTASSIVFLAFTGISAMGALTHFSNQGEGRSLNFIHSTGAIAYLPLRTLGCARLFPNDVADVLADSGAVHICFRARPWRVPCRCGGHCMDHLSYAECSASVTVDQ